MDANSRKKFILLLTLSFGFCLNLLNSQSIDSTAYRDLEVRKFYSVSTSQRSNGGRTIYKINNKKVKKRKYEKYASTWKNIETCCPCILKSYDVNDVLLSEGIMCTDGHVGYFKEYYPNGNLKLKAQYNENISGNWDDFEYSQADGEWLYYNEEGDVHYKEMWDNGEFVEQIPESDKIELWRVNLMLDDVVLNYKDKAWIKLADFEKLKVVPKYKNSNRYDNMELRIALWRNHVSINEVRVSAESLADFDIYGFVKETGRSKVHEMTCIIEYSKEGRFYSLPSFKLKK